MVLGRWLSVVGLSPSSFFLFLYLHNYRSYFQLYLREIFFFWEVDSLKLKLKFYLSTVLSCVNMSKIVWKFVVLLFRCFVVWLLVCI